MDLQNKKVVIIGAQKSGLAAAKLAKTAGASLVKISEMSLPEKFDASVHSFLKEFGIEVEWGGHTKDFVQDSDWVILSPGVRFDADPVKWAKEKCLPVLGEIEFAFQFCKVPVIAVTGSNGKTTTVNLIKNVLVSAGYKACLCGNVGTPFSEYAYEINQNDFVVLEVSSFQMESLVRPESIFRSEKSPAGWTVRGFKPYIGVILNFNPNHLDRHADIDEYFNAKSQIFLNQTSEDFAVLNGNAPRLAELAERLPSKIEFYNKNIPIENANLNDNQLAVLRVAQILNIKPVVCQEVFNSFKGIQHRMEFVRNLNGVDYINDSKATTVESGEWALNAMNKSVIMICGGYDKKLDYRPLRELVREKVKHMIVIGDTRPRLKETFSDVVALQEADSFEQAILTAKNIAKSGECVLLSPMCASFDMFKNFEHRGEEFKRIVNSL
ncbi:MAG: hypothetical protein HQL25_06100 [Candidatus Omnitrophica bacterium]|nr:hypothetical protein [Candidatus Omnitrophota bacterium]